MGKRARIHGSTLRARPLEEKALVARLLEHEVLPLFDDGRLSVPVADTFRCRTSPPPTTASPPAASSARSS